MNLSVATRVYGTIISVCREENGPKIRKRVEVDPWEESVRRDKPTPAQEVSISFLPFLGILLQVGLSVEPRHSLACVSVYFFREKLSILSKFQTQV